MGRKAAPGAVDAVFGLHRSSEIVVEGSCAAALLFGSASPTIDDSDAKSLAGLLLGAYEPVPIDGLAGLVVDEPIDRTRPPWRHGYELAEELWDELEDDVAGSAVDVESMLQGWNVRIDELDLHDPGLRAVSFASANHAPTIALNRSHLSSRSPQARRFTMAHELCHLLHDRSYGSCLAIASGPWAPSAIEQRANAFAAALLMPHKRLLAAIAWAESPINTHEGVRDVTRRLDVSRVALVEHLCNRGFVNEEERAALLLST